MILTWRRLWIHHCHHWRSLAEFSGEVGWTFTDVVVDAVNASSAILAHVILTVVDIFRAVSAAEAESTFACVMSEVVDALGAVGAGVEFGSAELNFLLAKFACKARQTTACVGLDAINTCTIVLAFVVIAVVDIDFTAGAFVSRKAFATEATFLQNRTDSAISTWISVAGVNHVFAVLTVIAGSASTLVLLLRLHHAFGVVLARECVAGIAL